MRNTIAIIVLGALTGCAVTGPGVSQVQQPIHEVRYTPAPAAALAFDPPALAGTPRLNLSRDDRQPGAFAGFEDSKTTFYYLQVDDRFGDQNAGGQGGKSGGRQDYERRAVGETTETIHN